jgi:ABC-type sugar transport system ATPase subunit
MTVENNITLCALNQIMRRGLLNRKKEQDLAKQYVDKLRIAAPSLDTSVKFLSGGNQQKICIAKWLTLNTDVFIVDEPTRGIDVGAKAEIYKILNNLVSEGKSVIMISSELPELMGMCDRIYVMHEGRIKGELQRNEFSQQRILEMAIL